MDEGYVKSSMIRDGIFEIEFFHPSHNSLPGQLLTELALAIKSAGEDKSVQVIVLRSGGDRTFCAGASFNELISIQDSETGKLFFMGFANVINACRLCPRLIIGRVQGKAVGGGVGLAAAADYVIATKFASIKLSELNIGIGPFVIGPAVSRKIGLSAMSTLAINSNEFQTAAWAQEKGLYAEVHESVEEMDNAVIQLAEFLSSTNPEARAELKKIFWEGTDHWDSLLENRAAQSGKMVLSTHTRKILEKYATT